MLDEEQLSFLTATGTVSDLVNIKRKGNILQDCMLPS